MVAECPVQKVLPLARIFKDTVKTKTCSGAFIAPNLFLTAAHCLPDQFRLEIPRFLRSPLSSIKWIIPEKYDVIKSAANESVAFDVGLVDFSDSTGKIYFKDHILPLAKTQVQLGQTVAFAGYGPSTLKEFANIESGKQNAYNSKLNAGVNTIKKFGIGDSATAMVTHGYEYGSFAAGRDSGGPVFAKDSNGHCGIVGVISRGTHDLSIFTNLGDPEIAAWLKAKLAARPCGSMIAP